MTFEQYKLFKSGGDAWDVNHSPRLCKRPRFVRHKGRVFQVLKEHDGLLHCEALSGKVQRKVLAAHDLDV